MSKIENEGKYRIFSESKNTYIEKCQKLKIFSNFNSCIQL